MYNNIFSFFDKPHYIRGDILNSSILFDNNDDNEDLPSLNVYPIKTINDHHPFEFVNNTTFLNDIDLSNNNFYLYSINNSSKNQPNKKDNELINQSFIAKKRNINEGVQIKNLCSTKTSSINGKMRKKNTGNQNETFHRKKHTSKDDDNVLRKLQVHYISFIISFVNDIIRAFNPKIPNFKKIDYGIKKKVKQSFVEELKSKTIGDILQLKVSSKMKKIGENYNKEVYNKIKEKCPEIQDFLQKNYITVFKEYYFNESKFIQVKDKIITLSSKTNTFRNLIEKNYGLKDNIIKVVYNDYLNCHKRSKKPKFISKKCQDKN